MEHFRYLYDLNSYAYNRKETGCTHPTDIHLSAVQPKKKKKKKREERCWRQ